MARPRRRGKKAPLHCSGLCLKGRQPTSRPFTVIPAQAGIQAPPFLDPRFLGDDGRTRPFRECGAGAPPVASEVLIHHSGRMDAAGLSGNCDRPPCLQPSLRPMTARGPGARQDITPRQRNSYKPEAEISPRKRCLTVSRLRDNKERKRGALPRR